MYLGLPRGLGGRRSRGVAWARDARARAMEMERRERLGCELESGFGCRRKWERGARRGWSAGGEEEGSRRLRGQSVTLRGKRSEGCFAAVALCPVWLAVALLRLDRQTGEDKLSAIVSALLPQRTPMQKYPVSNCSLVGFELLSNVVCCERKISISTS